MGAIRELIFLHQQILYDGGTHAHSLQYREFLRSRNEILKMFKLPINKEFKLTLATYPLSMVENIKEPCKAEQMIYKPYLFLFKYECAIRNDYWASKESDDLWGFEEKASFVYSNLKARRDEHNATPF